MAEEPARQCHCQGVVIADQHRAVSSQIVCVSEAVNEIAVAARHGRPLRVLARSLDVPAASEGAASAPSVVVFE